MLFCHQACCLLYYLGENNSGIHMYQFTSILLFSDVVVVSDLNKTFGGSADLHTPIHLPHGRIDYKNHFMTEKNTE